MIYLLIKVIIDKEGLTYMELSNAKKVKQNIVKNIKNTYNAQL